MRQRIYPLIVLCVSTLLLMGALVDFRQTFPTEKNVLADYAPQEPLMTPELLTSPEAEKPQPILPDNPIDFAALQEKSPEAVAWITVPNTNINYAVMQSGSDREEDYYLNRNEKGEKSRYGSVYIQKYNHADFSDPNTILYGHNMANGSMFANVHKFKKKAFFDENQYLYVYTPGHELLYRIYAVFNYSTEHLLWSYDFGTEEGYQAFIDKTLDPKTRIKQVRQDVSPTTADRVITLSTCLNNNEGDGRLLLVAVLEHDTKTK